MKPRTAPPSSEQVRAKARADEAYEAADVGEHEFKEGDTCGDWKIERFVAEGGMGEVYAVRTVIGGKRGALKRIRPQYATRADLGERFETEIRILAELDHPYIVGLLHAGMHERSPYFVMEWLDGVTLRDMLNFRREPFSLVEALSYVIRIAMALCAAHAVGILHRDLKPENVFMLKRGKLKVLDFGLGKLAEGNRARTSERLGGMCTVHYAAPEQLDRSTSVDDRTDVYALALVFVEMVTLLYAYADMPGVLPPKEVAQANQLFAKPNSLRKFLPNCPPSLAALIESALSKEKGKRPRSAEFLAGLRAEYRALKEASTSAAAPEIDDEDSGGEVAEAPANEPVRDNSAVRIIPLQLRTETLPPNQPPGDPTAAGNPAPPIIRTVRMYAPRDEDLEAARRDEAERVRAGDAAGDTTGAGRSATLPPEPSASRRVEGGAAPTSPWATAVPAAPPAPRIPMLTPHDPTQRIQDDAAARASLELASRPTLPWQRPPMAREGTPSLTPANGAVSSVAPVLRPKRVPIWAGPVLGVAITLVMFAFVKLVPSRARDTQSAGTATAPSAVAPELPAPMPSETAAPSETTAAPTATASAVPSASAPVVPTTIPSARTTAGSAPRPRAQPSKPKAPVLVEEDAPFIYRKKKSPPASGRLFGLETDDTPSAPVGGDKPAF